MNFESSITDVFTLLAMICKEKEYKEFQETLQKSYYELVKVEAETRREKASVLIRGMQVINRELKILNFEYNRVKKDFNIDSIPYFDQFIIEATKKRDELALLKNKLK